MRTRTHEQLGGGLSRERPAGCLYRMPAICEESTDSLAAARSFLFCSPPLRILVRVRVRVRVRARVS